MFPGQLGHIGGVPADVRVAPFLCAGGKDELARPVRCPRFPRVREEELQIPQAIVESVPLSPCAGGRAFQVQALKTAVMAFPACEGKSLLNISGISQDNSFPRVRGEEPPPPKRKQHYRRLSPCAGGEERSPNFYGRAPQFFRIREGKSGPSARSRFHTGFLQGAQSFCRVMLFLLALF